VKVLQVRAMASAALAGMTPQSAWDAASADSNLIMASITAASVQRERMAGVEKKEFRASTV